MRVANAVAVLVVPAVDRYPGEQRPLTGHAAEHGKNSPHPWVSIECVVSEMAMKPHADPDTHRQSPHHEKHTEVNIRYPPIFPSRYRRESAQQRGSIDKQYLPTLGRLNCR
ncbi:hypothetical protein BH10PLA2_BH10PLA2_12630 [soil metagenome]